MMLYNLFGGKFHLIYLQLIITSCLFVFNFSYKNLFSVHQTSSRFFSIFPETENKILSNESFDLKGLMLFSVNPEPNKKLLFAFFSKLRSVYIVYYAILFSINYYQFLNYVKI